MANSNGSEHGIAIPDSDSFVQVSVISNTDMVKLPWNLFFGPPRLGMDQYTCPDFCFLITHPDGQRLLFDLAVAHDWKTSLPAPQLPILEGWEANGGSITVSKSVRDILEAEGIVLQADKDAVLWSHPHFDHLGKVSDFPGIPLVVGKELITIFAPGYPENPKAPFWSDDLLGRKIVEAPLDQFEIGGFKAWDYFQDGSLYILDAPGHSPGHLNALARVGHNSFVHLGADSYHHASQIRPNKAFPLPDKLDVKIPGFPCPCPGHELEPLYAVGKDHEHDYYTPFVSRWSTKNSPLLTISYMEGGKTLATDPTAALDTIEKIQAFDGDDRIFCLPAHDKSLIRVLPLLPAVINDWKQEGWKEKTRWDFVSDYSPALSQHGK